MNYVRYSERLAGEIAAADPKGAIWANQFDNIANRRGHYETTGPEIWQQTDGTVDAFVCSVGTGGALAGGWPARKECEPQVKFYLTPPLGSAVSRSPSACRVKADGRLTSQGGCQGRIALKA